ncbi:MAG: hypothetical protein ACW981_20790, partial [Candidatus Hodarchaeales archaeon]
QSMKKNYWMSFTINTVVNPDVLVISNRHRSKFNLSHYNYILTSSKLFIFSFYRELKVFLSYKPLTESENI